jgi:hypothetical protein
MSKNPPITREHLLYFVILAMAFSLRFVNLGGNPLSEIEAGQALSAFGLSEGNGTDLGSHPSYIVLSGLTFAFLRSSEFLARFWPAFLGSAIVLFPFGLRDLLGRKAAILLSFGLAISPGFVATSRLASGEIFSVIFPIAALIFWLRGRATITGILAALALLSGAGSYVGLLGILLAWLILPIVDREGELASYLASFARTVASSAPKKPALISFGLSLLLGATLFLTVPQALSGIGESITSFLLSWTRPSALSVIQLPLSLIAYSLPALVFGLIGIVKAWISRERVGQILSLWVIASLLVAIINPGRQMADLLWTLIPLWTLAARELSRYMYLPKHEWSAVFGSVLLVLILGTFLWLNTAGSARLQPASDEFNSRLLISGALLFLGGVAFVLISYGWSRQLASYGLGWGLIILFLLVTLSSAMRFAYLGENSANELWLPGSVPGQAHLFSETLAELSDWKTGQIDTIDLVILNESRSLLWTFRDWPSARTAGLLSASEQPSLIITEGLESQPSQISAYRGQSFVWSSVPDWEKNLPTNLFAWLIFREAPIRSRYMTLWARADLFPLFESRSILDDSDTFEVFVGTE